ncbi:hypothetical protein [Micromonospora sp. URMC 103]|uniref:hypothetical protein n=1 Tax=Micromonospora sp. URMC 103 TaxID=3423406 RepID=UPI003F1DF672
MKRFDGAACGVVRGQLVKAKVLRHEPWGILATVLEQPDVGASVDAGLIDSPSGSPRALPEEYPPVGAEIDAVITEIDRYYPPVWIRLSIRASHLEALPWPCAFCGEPTVISAAGDGVTMDVKSADGPGSTSVVSHRRCLINLLHHSAVGEPARVARVGES